MIHNTRHYKWHSDEPESMQQQNRLQVCALGCSFSARQKQHHATAPQSRSILPIFRRSPTFPVARGRFYRPVTQSVTIRLNAPDVDAARCLSRLKGMPYQTYIKGLLHEALVRETKSAVAEVSRSPNKRGS
jgi:hypothetical protein